MRKNVNDLTDINEMKAIAEWPYNFLEYCDLYFDGPLVDYQIEGLIKAISTLKEREQRVVIRYFRDGVTLKEIGEEEGVTRERIRQVVAEAGRKIKHTSRSKYIFYGPDYLVMNKYITELENRKRYLENLAQQVEELEEKYPDLALRKEAVIGKMPTADKTDICELNLSVRAYNCVKREGCSNVGDIVPLFKTGRIKKIRNLGEKSYKEIYHALINFGFKPEDLVEEMQITKEDCRN